MRILPLLLFLALAACAPYKMDVRQGNLITADQREKLKTGMTRMQVQLLLGAPLLADPFHPNRWDYVYRLEHSREVVQQQRLTLYFEGDKLTRIDDSGMPALPASAPAPATGEEQRP